MSQHIDFHFAFYKLSRKGVKCEVKVLSSGDSLAEFVRRSKFEDRKIPFVCVPKTQGDHVPSYPAREIFGMDLLSFSFSRLKDPFTGRTLEGKPRYNVEVTGFDYQYEDENVKASALAESIWEGYLGYQEQRKEGESDSEEKLQPHEEYDFIFFNKAGAASYAIRSIRDLGNFLSSVTLAKHRNTDHFWFAHGLKTSAGEIQMDGIEINDECPRVDLLFNPGEDIEIKISWEDLEESAVCLPENLTEVFWRTYQKLWDRD